MTPAEVILTFLGFASVDTSNTYRIAISGDVPTSFAHKYKPNVFKVVFSKQQIEDDPEFALGVVLHEILHTLGENKKSFDALTAIKHSLGDDIVKQATNIGEDYVIEREGLPDYYKAKQYLEYIRISLYKKLDTWSDVNVDLSLETDYKYILALVRADILARAETSLYDGWYRRYLKDFDAKFGDSIIDLYNMIAHRQDEITHCPQGGASVTLFTQLLDELGYKHPDKDSSDEFSSDGLGELDSVSMGSAIPEGEDDKDSKATSKVAVLVANTFDTHDKDKLTLINGAKESGMAVVPDIRLVTEIVVKDTDTISHTVGHMDCVQEIQEALSTSKDTWLEGGKWSGKIKPNSHNKIKDLKAPFYKRRIPDLLLDTAIYVLVDCSGSMRNTDKDRKAAEAVAAINVALDIDNVALEIAGFTSTHDSEYRQYIFKAWDDTVSNPGVLYSRMMTVNYVENDDGLNLLYSFNKLIQRHERRKILIVLSDGYPAGRLPGDHEETLRLAVQMIEESKLVELYGIGICTNSVRKFYKNNTVVNNVSELGVNLLKLLKSSLFNNHEVD